MVHKVETTAASGNLGQPSRLIRDEFATWPQVGDSEAGDDDPMRRREFTAALGASLLSAPRTNAEGPLTSVGDALVGHGVLSPASPGPIKSRQQLRATVDQAKRDYQACRYRALATRLPQLVADCQAAGDATRDEEQQQAFALLAETWHVATSLLLKLGDGGLACLTSDRSVRAAHASEDDLAVGSSARIFTHALLASGHGHRATEWAVGVANKLSAANANPTSLSVNGALLLRGAVAAAREDDRSAALSLLDEADETGRRLGTDGNHYWTAFGPTNVLLHRINIATTLGDAGTALAYARQLDLTNVTVLERRASFWIDVARASSQRARHPHVLAALREAETCAPEEVRARPVVRALVTDLRTRAPRTSLDGLDDFATRIGAMPQ